MSLTRGLVLDAANQLGGASPGVVTLHDWSREKNDGTITDVTWTQLPTGLWVMNFNGASSYVDLVGVFTAISGDDTFAIEGWFYANSLTGVTSYWSAAGNNSRLYLFCINSKFKVSRNGTDDSEAGTSGLAGQWQYVVIVFTSSSNAKLYIDGSFVEDLTVGAQATVTDDINLGNYHDADLSSYVFDGFIALPKIYNYAITPAQIRARYHSEKWLFGVAS